MLLSTCLLDRSRTIFSATTFLFQLHSFSKLSTTSNSEHALHILRHKTGYILEACGVLFITHKPVALRRLQLLLCCCPGLNVEIEHQFLSLQRLVIKAALHLTDFRLGLNKIIHVEVSAEALKLLPPDRYVEHISLH